MSALWLPASPCTPRCLGAPGRARRTGRLAAFLAALLVAALAAPALAVLPGRFAGALTRALARTVLRALGVRVVVRGRAPRTPALLVANHVSWLDPLVLLAVVPARAVAKREVRAWPLVGALVAATGAIFIDRLRPRTLPATVAAIRAALRGGASVLAFPEGTTTCGAEPRRLRPALFQAAVDAGAPVVPSAIRYDSPAAAFVGDDTLAASLRRVATAGRLTVTVTLGPALYPEPGADRRALARAAEATIGPVAAPAWAPTHHALDLAA